MILEELGNKYYKVNVSVKEVIRGNTYDEFEELSIKVRCTDCTIMFFKEDFEYARNLKAGDIFSATVKKYKGNTYNFKKLIIE